MSNNSAYSFLTKFKFHSEIYSVLIVEDSKSVNKIINNNFTEKGYRVYSAFSIKEAKNILSTITIDYIILDINLPDGNGIEIINQVEFSHEKVFVLTSQRDETLREDAYKKGIIDFIIKDVDFLFHIDNISQSIENLEKNKIKTVLLIGDSLVIQQQLNDILQNRNYNIELAGDIILASDILSSKKIDLILLDIELKDANGIEFLRKNKNLIIIQENIPVIIISEKVDSTTVRDALKAGVVDIIKKPYIVEEILLKVDLWIDYRRQKEEITRSYALLSEYKNAVDESAIVSKTTAKGIITFVNDQFCKLSGYSREELIGKNHNIVRHDDMSSSTFKEVWYTIKELKKTWKGKVKNRKKDGSYYWVEALIKPIIGKDGEIIEFIGLRNDITEIENYKTILKDKLNDQSKSLEENINYTKQYEDALNQFTAILKTDTNNVITYINDEFSKLSGYTPEELIGTNCENIRHINHRLVGDCNLLRDTLSKNEHISFTFTNIAKDNSLYFVEMIAYPITNMEGEVVEHLQLMHNITELTNLHKEIEETQKEIVYKMGEIGESRSKETGNHVKRVAEYSKKLALLSGLGEDAADVLFTASPMHDIGKIAIPDSILKKPGRLTSEEFEIMKTHVSIGYDILKGSEREVLNAAAIVANEHHERWDGKGYPKGLKEDNIHIYGRITAIADVFDALGSDRCYKSAWDDEKIFALFQAERATQFDPNLVDIFLDNKDVFIEIRDKYRDN